jgi:hypothetical protein
VRKVNLEKEVLVMYLRYGGLQKFNPLQRFADKRKRFSIKNRPGCFFIVL